MGARAPDIIFPGPQFVPIGSGFSAASINRNQLIRNAAIAGLGEKSLDDDFGLLILALTENLMPDASLRVGEIECWPILVVERAPYRMVVIDHDWILDAHVLRSPANAVNVFLE